MIIAGGMQNVPGLTAWLRENAANCARGDQTTGLRMAFILEKLA